VETRLELCTAASSTMPTCAPARGATERAPAAGGTRTRTRRGAAGAAMPRDAPGARVDARAPGRGDARREGGERAGAPRASDDATGEDEDIGAEHPRARGGGVGPRGGRGDATQVPKP
jgi:hypothetical protein